jgi:opacity protein-like surface antigen
MFKRLVPASILVVTAATSALLSAPAWTQGYVGVALGANFFNDAEYFEIEDESTAFEVKGGVRLADVLGIEMSYLNLGEFRDLYADVDLGFSGVTVSGKAILPLGEQMDVYAKVGIYFWELDQKYGYQSYLLDEGEDLIFGGGAAFYVTENLSVDLEYRLLEMVDLESDLFTAGITFSF